MLKLIRILLVLCCSILISIAGVFYALVRLRNPDCVGEIAYWYSKMHKLLGIKLIRRPYTGERQPAIYIANHQNNYDMVTISSMTLHNKVDLNRWDNGTVICEELEPIDTSSYNRDNLKELIEHCHQVMQKRIAELDAEIEQLDK